MKFEITHSPAFSKLDAVFDEGELLYAQPKSMICMSTGFEITAQIGGPSGGSVVGAMKSMLSGEGFAISIFRAKHGGESVSLAPNSIGEIIMLELDGSENFYLTKGAYLAHESGVTLTPKFSGLRGWMAKKGVYLLHASGKGRLFVNSFGAVISKTLADQEAFVVDNEYVVAFSDTIEYELVTATSGIKDSLMSGEGLVNRYRGPGTVYYQTRSRQRMNFLGSILSLAT